MKKPINYCTRIFFILSCFTILFSGCRSVDDGGNAVSLAAIKVTPSSTSLDAGQVLQLSAARLYTNATTEDCSSEATWTSSATTVATFSASTNGLLSANAAGTTTISATCSGVTKTYTMTVLGAATLVTLEVSPVNKTIANTTKLIVVATGVYSDNSVKDLTDLVHWTSSNDAIVSLERSNGSNSIQVKANSAGSGEAITASYAGITGSATINVSAATISSVTVTPVNPSLAVGARLSIKATGLYNDDTVQEITDFATWSSSNTTAAIVSNINNGVTDALVAGTATITADGGTTTVTVGSATLDSIEVSPLTQSMVVNSKVKCSAIGIYSDNTTIDLTSQVTWSSSDTELLSVDNTQRNKGNATAIAVGTAYISASLPGSTKGASAVITIADLTLSSIEVTPKNPEFAANLDLDFKAIGVFSNGSTEDLTDSVIWSSSAPSILKINNASQITGQARSLAAGTATVTATFGSTSGTSSATVSTATLSSIQITPPGSSLASGYKRWLTATGIFSDNSTFDLTRYVSWQSTLTPVVMNHIAPFQGVAIATASGSTPTITASFKGMNGQDGTISGTTTITTTTATLSSIEVAPGNPSCVAGINTKFTATGIFSDSTTLDMTSFVVWKSSDIAVSIAKNAIGVQGHFQCVKAGTATVTAASGTTSGTTTLLVY